MSNYTDLHHFDSSDREVDTSLRLRPVLPGGRASFLVNYTVLLEIQLNWPKQAQTGTYTGSKLTGIQEWPSAILIILSQLCSPHRP